MRKVHGSILLVAMLAIAGRLVVLEGGLDELIDDLLKHVAPDCA